MMMVPGASTVAKATDWRRNWGGTFATSMAGSVKAPSLRET